MEQESDPWDPDRLICCPYNKSHHIRASRFPYHIVKCRRSHPEVAELFDMCPFNARHVVPRAELRDHITTCSDQRLAQEAVEVAESFTFRRELMNAVSTWQPPPCEEDWEEESSEQPDSPFIWGMTTLDINSTTSGWKNYLPPGVRAPRSLPFTIAHGKAGASQTSVMPSIPYMGASSHIRNGESSGNSL